MLAERLALGRRAVGHAVAVRRIVVPLAVAIAVGVEVVGADAGRPVDVHGRIAVAPAAAAVTPVPAAEHRRAGGNAQAEHHAGHKRRAVIGRWRIIGRRIGRIGPRAVGPGRIVVRHVHDFRIGRLDDDRIGTAARLRRHLLLRRRLQVARRLRLGTQPLDRRRDVLLLADHRVAQLLGPVELVAHHLQRLRKRGERLHADVPALVLHRRNGSIALEVGIGLRPARRLNDLQGIGRTHQHLRQKRVGIEGDGRQQLVELLGRERLVGILAERAGERSQGQHSRRQCKKFASFHVLLVP